MGLFSVIISSLSYSAVLIVFWKGGSLVLSQSISPGDLSSFMLVAISLSGALMRLERTALNILNSLGVAERLFSMID
jgi:ABC-type multidrug transport system fused ATPase/permease subunit